MAFSRSLLIQKSAWLEIEVIIWARAVFWAKKIAREIIKVLLLFMKMSSAISSLSPEAGLQPICRASILFTWGDYFQRYL